MAGYSYISFAQLTAALLGRLQDTAASFTSNAEAQIYLTEALRVLNAQTAIWNVDYLLDFVPNVAWVSINQPGSPRQRTVTDTQVETQMEYMLLEPPTGGTWTGTNQFSIANLSNALQYRRDELLQMSGANMGWTLANSPTTGVRTILADSTLGLRRVRWAPAAPSTEPPYALWREDVTSVDAYGDQLSVNSGVPESWLITANSPLAFDVSCTPNVPGMWDMLAFYSGTPLSPPSATVLGLPDDWCWVAMYGALADALANSPEAADQLRAKYCLARYERGMKAMMTLPWLLRATVAGLPVGTPSVIEMDAYAQNWENNWSSDDPQIVVGGMDFVALGPFNGSGGFGTGGFGRGGFGDVLYPISTVLRVVGNAPVDPAQSVQLSRDGVDAVLAYAQHIAMFKTGGADFSSTFPLLKQFDDYCATQNHRYAALGIFRPEMILEGNRGDALDPRFGPEVENG